jgi:hypothetical protein
MVCGCVGEMSRVGWRKREWGVPPVVSYLVFWMVDTSLLREESFLFKIQRTETKSTKFTCRTT